MSFNHNSSPAGKNTIRLKDALKSQRKHGVSPKFIQQIVISSTSQPTSGQKTQAS